MTEGPDNAATTEAAWIEWDGGNCPVEGSVLTEIRIRDGFTYIRPADNFNWRHGGGAFAYASDSDIVAYRLVSTI